MLSRFLIFNLSAFESSMNIALLSLINELPRQTDDKDGTCEVLH